MRAAILVTPRSLTQAGVDSVPSLLPLREAGYDLVGTRPGALPTLEELAAVDGDIVGWIAGVERIGAAELDCFPALRGISRNGTGADGIDADAARARGIAVAVARGANARGVAELTLAHILNALRRLTWAHNALSAGTWTRTLGTEMPDTTIGIVGFGAVGRLVARFATALDARVLAHDPFAELAPDSPVRLVGLDELLERSTVVTLHAPPPEGGGVLIGARELERMPVGGVLVNTARSSLVDPDAVLEALRSGRLASYSVDAYDQEPPAPSELLRHPGTVLTPHLGGYTASSMVRATDQAVLNLLSILNP